VQEQAPAIAPVSLPTVHEAMRQCRRCAEAGHPTTPGAVFSGSRDARILLVGQAPSATDRDSGQPFQGPAGRRLFEWLERAGFSEKEFRDRAYLTAITHCFPGRTPSGRGDRVPSREEQALCRPFLDLELALVRPEVLLPVGRLAIRRFLGAKPLDLVVGTVHRDEAGRWIVPLPHPSGASRWLNDPVNAGHLERALRHLARLRHRLRL